MALAQRTRVLQWVCTQAKTTDGVQRFIIAVPPHVSHRTCSTCPTARGLQGDCVSTDKFEVRASGGSLARERFMDEVVRASNTQLMRFPGGDRK